MRCECSFMALGALEMCYFVQPTGCVTGRRRSPVPDPPVLLSPGPLGQGHDHIPSLWEQRLHSQSHCRDQSVSDPVASPPEHDIIKSWCWQRLLLYSDVCIIGLAWWTANIWTTPQVNDGQNILKCVWVKMKKELWCQAITNVEYSCNKQHWLYMCICNLSVCHWCRYRTHPCRVSEALLSHVTPMLSPARYRRSSLAERFSAELPGLSLPQVLSTLELPRQMAELKATYADVRYRLIITCVSYSPTRDLVTPTNVLSLGKLKMNLFSYAEDYTDGCVAAETQTDNPGWTPA